MKLLHNLLAALAAASSLAHANSSPSSSSSSAATDPAWSRPPVSPPRGQCRCYPGDNCWPVASVWSAFNATIGGRLLATVPLAAPCHPASPSADAAAQCASLQAQWFTPGLHTGSPSSVMAPLFTNNSCNPFLPPGAGCEVGSYVRYSVNVSEPIDVARTIWFATHFNIRLVIKNTGHDYSGKSTGAGAIALWTHNLKDVSFQDYASPDYTGKAVRLGAGVEGSEVYQRASAKGLVVVGPETPTVGLAGGYTQGGGHSSLSSRYGLAADQVLEWDVVDGKGRLLKASRSTNPDLYWALCGGGGGTYGVVVSVTIKAYKDVPVTGAIVSFTSEGVTQDQYYDVLATFQASLPKIVDAGAVAVWFFNNATFSLSPLTAPGLSPEKVNTLLGPLESRLQAYNMSYALNVTKFPGFWQQFSTQVAPVQVGVGLYGGRLIPRSVVEKNNTELTAAYRYINRQGAFVAGIGLGVSKSVVPNPWNAVNPAWRTALIENVIQVPYNYTAPLGDMYETQDLITRDLVPKLERLTPGGGAYLNEADFQQPNWQRVFYGNNYNKLKGIKDTYDPYHMFYALTAVGSEYWEPQADGRLCKA